MVEPLASPPERITVGATVSSLQEYFDVTVVPSPSVHATCSVFIPSFVAFGKGNKTGVLIFPTPAIGSHVEPFIE